jgi:hypothetical protein
MRSWVMAGFGADGLGGTGGGVVMVGTGSVIVVVVGGGLVPATVGGGDDDDVMLLAPFAAAQPATVRITALTTAATPQPIARTI